MSAERILSSLTYKMGEDDLFEKRGILNLKQFDD